MLTSSVCRYKNRKSREESHTAAVQYPHPANLYIALCVVWFLKHIKNVDVILRK
jgi:hypothetical protein